MTPKRHLGADDGQRNDGREFVRFGAIAETLQEVIFRPTGRGIAMTRKLVLLLATLMFGSISLTACNTMQGAGRDIEKVGTKVQEEAQEHKKY